MPIHNKKPARGGRCERSARGLTECRALVEAACQYTMTPAWRTVATCAACGLRGAGAVRGGGIGAARASAVSPPLVLPIRLPIPLNMR